MGKEPRGGFSLCLLAVSVLSALGTSAASANDWTGGSGDWFDSANWSAGMAPNYGDNANLIQTDAIDRTVVFADPLSFVDLNFLDIDALGAGRITLQHSAGDLHTYRARIGVDGAGRYLQSGGFHSTTELMIGVEMGSDGLYTQTGGSLDATTVVLGREVGSVGQFEYTGGNLHINQQLVVGARGTGTFVYNPDSSAGYVPPLNIGGYAFPSSFVLGEDLGSQGTFIQQAGDVFSNSNLIVGYQGSGLYDQRAGWHDAGYLQLGGMAGAYGEYRMSEDDPFAPTRLTTWQMEVGGQGQGLFEQSGGWHQAGEIDVGFETGGSGTYRISGGQLEVDRLVLGFREGSQGRFEYTGGDLQINNQLVVGQFGRGTFVYNPDTSMGYALPFTVHGYDYPAGIVLGKEIFGQGAFIQQAGQVDSRSNLIIGYEGQGLYDQRAGWHDAGDLQLGARAGSYGEYRMSEGDPYAPGFEQTYLRSSWLEVGVAGQGLFEQSGGWHEAWDIVVGAMPGGGGTYRLTGGQLDIERLVLGQTAGSTGRFEYTGGDLFINSQLVIGEQGNGTFVYNPDTSMGYVPPFEVWGYGYPAGMVLGQYAGSQGTFIQQDGEVRSNSDMIIGYEGYGRYDHRGGIHDAGHLRLGYVSGSLGEYRLSESASIGGGYYPSTLYTSLLQLGVFGKGRFEQTGGMHYSDHLVVGADAGGDGRYTMTGGTLDTSQTWIGAVNGARGEMILRGMYTDWHNANDVLVGDELLAGRTIDDLGHGVLSVEDDASLHAMNVMIRETGTLKGNGHVYADVFNAGEVLPGMSPGTLHIGGDYTQLANGVLGIEIGEFEHDRLIVDGVATLGGALDVSLFDITDLYEGLTFDILWASSVIGTFDDRLFPIFNGKTFDIAYAFDHVSLTVVSAVPVPAAVWLFISGLGGLLVAARRRRH